MGEPQYQVQIPDLEYYEKLIPCRSACPVYTDSFAYVQAIGRGEYEQAFEIACAPNPFVFVCGRICGHPCEYECRRGKIDEPIAIRALKRFACDQHDAGRREVSAAPPSDQAPTRPTPRHPQKVAVIGAGPAGLAAARDLALFGYSVTVFEARDRAGGMMVLGVPEYRLPRAVVQREVDAILARGVELKLGQAVGRDFSLADLRAAGYEAIFLALGAHRNRSLKIPGVDLDGVLNGLDFLLNVNLGYRVELGQQVIVVGGGNVAIDVARMALRAPDLPASESRLTELGYRKMNGIAVDEALHTALDVARTARRRGAEEIHLISLQKREEMPLREIEEALEEGIHFHPARGPQRIIGEKGRVTGLETIHCAAVFDAAGRFNPTFVEGTEEVMEADSIILAIGQAVDLSFLQPNDGVEITPRGTIAIDPQTLATTAPGLFAGGDVAFGPRLIIDAVADGRKAAQSIHDYLQQRQRPGRVGRMTEVKPDALPEEGYLEIGRQPIPVLPVDRRIGIAEVETGYDKAAALMEGKRCLHCNINPVFDGNKCILCGGCVDVCPEYCLKLVRLDELHMSPELARLIEQHYGLSLNDALRPGVGTAIIKDEDLCIRCGLCAKRCPTGAITMEAFEVEVASR